MSKNVSLIRKAMLEAGENERTRLLEGLDDAAKSVTYDNSLSRQERVEKYAIKMIEAAELEDLNILKLMTKEQLDEDGEVSIDCYLRHEIKTLFSSGSFVEAKGKLYVNTGKILVYKGATVVTEIQTTGKYRKTLEKMRAVIDIEGTENPILSRLSENRTFNSPSAASGFILGTTSNGWTEWKDKDGKPIDIYRCEEEES